MSFRIREKGGQERLYAGERDGWVSDKPPEEIDPADKAQQFDTKEEAQKFIDQHGMKADVEPVEKPRKGR